MILPGTLAGTPAGWLKRLPPQQHDARCGGIAGSTELGVKPPRFPASPCLRLSVPIDYKIKELHSTDFEAPTVTEIWDSLFPH